jgi:MFS family permease
MMFSLLPIYIIEELGVSSESFGFLVGLTTSFTLAARICTGFLMDILKKRKLMLYVGTTLALVSKLLLACFSNINIVFLSKFIDRFAKGFRRASIDVILADFTKKKGGSAFSFRYVMNLAGYVTGSILTSTILTAYGNNFRFIFMSAVIPAMISLYTLERKINYEEETKISEEKIKWKIKDISLLPNEYWKFMIVVALLIFNRFDEGFITLRAREVLPGEIWKFPLLMSGYEISAAAIALLVGRIVDKIDKRQILIYGMLILFSADIFGMFANNFATILPIYILAGIHMGATQWVLLLIIARLAPKNIFGTAFAIFYAIEALAALCSNCLAGGLSSKLALLLGLQASTGPFIQGAVVSFIITIYLVRSLKKRSLA